MDNLGKIGESLNTNFNESIEKELQQSFRLAAQSLTELFKGGKKATKKCKLNIFLYHQSFKQLIYR